LGSDPKLFAGGGGGGDGGRDESKYSRGISTEGDEKGGVEAEGALIESVRTRFSVAAALISKPHEIQKFDPSTFSVPQAGHLIIDILHKKRAGVSQRPPD
jgi:hypothetical protein